MLTVNIHQAKTHLSRLVEQAANGKSFIIAKAGRPLVKVTRLERERTRGPIGFMKGEFEVPGDFKTMGEDEIIAMFEGTD